MKKPTYNPLPELIPADLLKRAAKLSPAQLCDGMEKCDIPRNGCMDASLMPLDPDKLMIGTACTVDTLEGDNFPIHVAVYQSRPGYVLIVAGKGYQDRAYMGDLVAGAAAAIGLNGIVIDGCVRDQQGMRALPIPVYTKGVIQRSPTRKSPGRINTEVECAGVRVQPGDLVIGDSDGVTVIPRAMIETVLQAAEEKDAYELKRREAIAEYEECRRQGKPLPDLAPGWVAEMLEKI